MLRAIGSLLTIVGGAALLYLHYRNPFEKEEPVSVKRSYRAHDDE